MNDEEKNEGCEGDGAEAAIEGYDEDPHCEEGVPLGQIKFGLFVQLVEVDLIDRVGLVGVETF